MSSHVDEAPHGTRRQNSLGAFSILPAEIRLIIWEYLLRNIPKGPAWDPALKPLAIARCSSTLYHEISHRLYKDLSLLIDIDCRCLRWGQLQIQFGKLGMKLVRNIEDKFVAQGRLRAFPYFRIPKITVNIHAPSHYDYGDTICLGQKINQLVDICHGLPWTPHIQVVLEKYWIDEKHLKKRRIFHAIPLSYEEVQDKTSIYRSIYDCDSVILPFTRLATWDLSIPSKLHQLLFTDERLDDSFISISRHHGPNNVNPCDHLTEDEARQIPRWRFIARRLHDYKLDRCFGESADILRSERIESWYKTDGSWESEYEQQLWRDLATDFDAMMMIDPGLTAAKNRYRETMSCHDMAFKHFSGLPLRSVSCPLSYIWNPGAIRNKWPLGSNLRIFPSKGLGRDYGPATSWDMCDVTDYRFDRYIAEVPHCREFWEDLDWWASSAYNFMSERLIGPRVCPRCFAMNAPCKWCQRFDVNHLCPQCTSGEVGYYQ